MATMEEIYAEAVSLKKTMEETKEGKAELEKLYGKGDARKTLSKMKKAELEAFVTKAKAYLKKKTPAKTPKKTPAKKTPAKKTPVTDSDDDDVDDDESSTKSVDVDDIVAALANLDPAEKKKVLKECVKCM